jgi:hypothetical protein
MCLVERMKRAIPAALFLCCACGAGDSQKGPDLATPPSATPDPSGSAGDAGDAGLPGPAPSVDGGAPSPGDAGGTGQDASKDPPPPPPKVGACDGLGAVGEFQDITPAAVRAAVSGGKQGTFAFAADPVNQGTVYLGTFMLGVWKSTDCGATWTHISTGRSGAAVDSGMNWTFKIDPQDPNVVYTNSGYGANGLFKSANGGVDWDVVWPPPGQPDLAKAFTYNFANVLALDPADHQHILLTFHETCLAPHNATCIAESFDAGSSWKLNDGLASWSGNEGQIIFFLNGSKEWLWGSQSNGFWSTTDGGTTWDSIGGASPSHLQSSGMIRTASGAFMVAASEGVFRSPDGKSSTWSLVPNTGPIAGGLVFDGTSAYVSTCYFGGFCNNGAPYLKSTDDGKTWSVMPSPKQDMGGSMDYDSGHSLMYSSNLSAFWRVRVK